MKKIFILIVVSLFLLPLFTQAAGRKNENVYLGADEVVDGNFYAIGGMVEIQGTVNSDLIILGGQATIKGLIKGDILALGGNLRIDGEVDGNIRAVAGQIEINGKIGKNVMVAGGNLLITDGSEINGNLTFAVGNVKIDGKIFGKVDGAGGNLVFNNEVLNDVNLNAGNDGVIILMPKTNFAKDFYYKASQKAEINEGAKINGQTYFEQFAGFGKKRNVANYLFGKIIGLFSLIIIGLVLIALMQKKIHQVAEYMQSRPWPALGWGSIYLIIIPIFTILLMITVIGLPLGLICLTIYFIILYVSQIFIGLIIGKYFLDYFKLKSTPTIILVTGLVIWTILVALPYVGWLIKLLGLLWALGAILEIIKSSIKPKSGELPREN